MGVEAFKRVAVGLASIAVSGFERHCRAMRFIIPLVALALLAACETTTATAPTATPTPTASAPASSRVGQMLATAGRDNAATQADVVRLLGAPDIERHEGAGTALTYRLENCALLLLFVADQRNAMRLAEAHPSARRPSEPAPSLETCAAEASNRGS
ncbi:hypothetical protein DSM104635_03870 [Terricaulis silvestris]|uniref:Uncharacterized protein n=1 Tax=Terricaulis silvestris TaxID=2686094 RepID=A0A6I6MN98_9CAUL|nr:hypothetical protein DSM104635_03870 [Terricaulis silvestris]